MVIKLKIIEILKSALAIGMNVPIRTIIPATVSGHNRIQMSFLKVIHVGYKLSLENLPMKYPTRNTHVINIFWLYTYGSSRLYPICVPGIENDRTPSLHMNPDPETMVLDF